MMDYSCLCLEIVISVSLQAGVAKHKGAEVCASRVRSFLGNRGHRWFPRRQKRKHDREHLARLQSAGSVRILSRAGRRSCLNRVLIAACGHCRKIH